MAETVKAPNWRYMEASRCYNSNLDAETLGDMWSRRMTEILKLRGEYDNSSSFAKDWPLFSLLLDTGTAVEYTSYRNTIHAMLIGGATIGEVEEFLSTDNFDSAFLRLYALYFWDLPPNVKKMPAWIHANIIVPAMSARGDKIEFSHIWNLIAVKVGYERFLSICLKGGQYNKNDIRYIDELGMQRTLTTHLRYAADGFFDEADTRKREISQSTMNNLMAPTVTADEMDAESGALFQLEAMELGGSMVMKYKEPKAISDKAAALSGTFRPELPEAVETINVSTYIKHDSKTEGEE